MSRTLPKVSRDVYKNIATLAGPNCHEVTNKYQNCRPPFTFKRGDTKASCCDGCMKHLDQWLLPFLLKLPEKLNAANGTVWKKKPGKHNIAHLDVVSRGTISEVYITVSMRPFRPPHATGDLETIIRQAQHIIESHMYLLIIRLPYDEIIEEEHTKEPQGLERALVANPGFLQLMFFHC